MTLNTTPAYLRGLIGTGLVVFLCANSQAQTFRLDDSTSPRARIAPRAAVDETGAPLLRALEPDRAVLRFGEVGYRLDMRPHLGRSARVYFVRAAEAESATGTRLNWSTANGQLGGSLASGERALIWSGKVEQSWMEFGLVLEMDFNLLRWRPRRGPGSADVVTYFELERQP